MTTGLVVVGRGDLDVLFKARTSAAIADTGFRSNGGVDVAQRFEPRGATAAIGATGFVKSGTDLAQLFMNIASSTTVSGNLIAGNDGNFFGYQASNGFSSPYGSCSISLVGVNTLLCLNFNGISAECSVIFGHGSVTPADADSTWERIECTGTFASGSGTRTVKRSVAHGTSTTSGGGFLQRTWQLGGYGGPPPQFINGNTYTVNVFKP